MKHIHPWCSSNLFNQVIRNRIGRRCMGALAGRGPGALTEI